MSKLLNEVRSREPSVRIDAAIRTRDYVVAQNRELSAEAFSKFMRLERMGFFVFFLSPFFFVIYVLCLAT